jgi:hypothetical protein
MSGPLLEGGPRWASGVAQLLSLHNLCVLDLEWVGLASAGNGYCWQRVRGLCSDYRGFLWCRDVVCVSYQLFIFLWGVESSSS